MKVLTKLIFFLNRSEKIKAFCLLLMMLFGAILEALGIALIASLLNIISTPEKITKSEYLNWLYDYTGATSNNEFLLWLIGLLLAVYIFK